MKSMNILLVVLENFGIVDYCLIILTNFCETICTIVKSLQV